MRRSNTLEHKSMVGSTLAKIIAYFLLTISLLIGGINGIGTAYLAADEVYSYGDSQLGLANLAKMQMYSTALSDIQEFYNIDWPKEPEALAERLEDFCRNKNVQIEVWRKNVNTDEDSECIVGNYDDNGTPYSYHRVFTEYEEAAIEEVQETKEAEPKRVSAVRDTESEPVVEMITYDVWLYVNPQFAVYDDYKVIYEQTVEFWNVRYILPVVTLVSVFVCICSFIFLMCSAGHKNGKEGITPSVLNSIHIDVLTAVFGVMAICGLVGASSFTYDLRNELNGVVFAFIMTVVIVWCTIYCAELAVRMKLGQWWKHSLIYIVCRFVFRGIRFLWRCLVTLIKGLPLIVSTILVCSGICIFEFILMVMWGPEDFPVIWFIEKLILVPAVLYIAVLCKKLQQGSAALAEGNMNYKVDTKGMFLDFKEHGENLNQIGQGISKAVNERMKSEHLKTELITNVSHDLKTPLTSIINYADLLGNIASKENHLEQAKVAEYSEVLLRQSKRLKKLLEDLVEASKATTGNIEVKMEKCEVGVLLSQAVGEYESRFWEKLLTLVIKQPDEPVWIMADGRRLWRVFDNLLNNVCKYAQENTRVYLTVEPKEGQVEIIFRNMSKYPLDLSGEELEERFVRGDKSRHMEGNGLGLSIAKSLVELQNGKMEIVTDGDLFKVILRFAVLDENEK